MPLTRDFRRNRNASVLFLAVLGICCWWAGCFTKRRLAVRPENTERARQGRARRAAAPVRVASPVETVVETDARPRVRLNLTLDEPGVWQGGHQVFVGLYRDPIARLFDSNT